MTPLRVALFSDSHYEANGVARTTGALEEYARQRRLPLLSVHAGPETAIVEQGSIVRLELERRTRTSFRLEHDLRFDVGFWRHTRLVARELQRFRPDVLHFTGPSDVGQIGAYLGYRLGIPMVGSWHTNLHEYAVRRLGAAWLPDRLRRRVLSVVERRALDICLWFYRIPHAVLAPNQELLEILERGTGKPCFLMSRGVDVAQFTPAKRTRTDATVNIGYVGRLSPEKSVRVLADVERTLAADGLWPRVRLTVVGDGLEKGWLRRCLRRVTFTGVLRGDALAEAYANMDLFVCPSQTETVGNVVLEAMASGVAVVAMKQGGPRFVTGSGDGAVLASDHRALIETVRQLVQDRARRETMQTAARAWALTRSWDAVFDGVYRAYAEAVDLASRPAKAAGPINAESAWQRARGAAFRRGASSL
jgi:phosphatidylinositol alpha 1,6-mannosyltransferase